jgi:alkylation response protein AidB-like acyl-CoA dehydrogenase
LTEPQAGSDVQGIATRAVPLPDGSWELHGHKRWITNGLGDAVLMMLCVTDPDAVPTHRGMTC